MYTRPAGAGLALAVASAAAFGTSGSFASALVRSGWTPGAAVLIRIALAAAALTPMALRRLSGRWTDLRRSWAVVAAYGLIAVAGCQLFYFNALEHLSVSVALLLEYLGIVLVVGWMWLRHGQRPRRVTIAGGTIAIAGLVLVLDLTGPTRVDPIGVVWGLAAATGLAAYFVISARSDDALPPLVLAWAGMVVGAAVLAAAGIAHALPLSGSARDVVLLHRPVPWFVPVLGLSLVAAALAYVAGITAARVLGPRLASFVGLGEVVFAVLLAWLLLGQLPGGLQAVGGALIIAGVALVRLDELRQPQPQVSEAVPVVTRS